MFIINLLDMSNYVQFNSDLANIFGLETAIYLQELISIDEKARRKNKYVSSEEFFKVDRNYIRNRTTLDTETQKICDNVLKCLDIISVGVDDNNIKLNVENILQLSIERTEEIKKEIHDIVKKLKKDTTKVATKKNITLALKAQITTLNPREKEAYDNWIDTIILNGKVLDNNILSIFKRKVESYARGNVEKVVGVLEKATTLLYVDADWAIDKYEQDHNRNKAAYATGSQNQDQTIIQKRTVGFKNIEF